MKTQKQAKTYPETYDNLIEIILKNLSKSKPPSPKQSQYLLDYLLDGKIFWIKIPTLKFEFILGLEIGMMSCRSDSNIDLKNSKLKIIFTETAIKKQSLSKRQRLVESLNELGFLLPKSVTYLDMKPEIVDWAYVAVDDFSGESGLDQFKKLLDVLMCVS